MRLWLLTAVLVLASVGCATQLGDAPQTAPPPATATVTATVQPKGDAAIIAARLRLTKNGLENPDLVTVIGITTTTWTDDCVGLPSSIACHTNTTPGYIIELEKEGQRYLVHTDQDGTVTRLAWSTIPPIRDAFVQWRYSDGKTCRTALIGEEQMEYGLCGEAMLAAPTSPSLWNTVKGTSQASYLSEKYAPFTANTIHGSLVYSGTGAVAASQAEQRALAEWAWTRYEDANSNYLPADYGMELYWQERSTPLSGVLWIYRTGLAVAWECSGNAEEGVDFLSAAQLEQFYTWLDSGKVWNINLTDRVNEVPPNTSLHFPWSRTGEKTIVQDAGAVVGFARQIYTDLCRK
jgi:hypothetical protein